MRLSITLAASLLILTFSLTASACPKGPRDQELNIGSVMRNFGRFLVAADTLVTQGPKGASDQEFSTAIDGLTVALSCTDAVLHDPQGALWPTKAHSLSGAERENYLRIFYEQMRAFAEKLSALQSELGQQKARGENERDFTSAVRLKNEIREAARKAHEATQ